MDIHPKSNWHNPDFKELTGGFYPKGDKIERVICDLEPWDITRRDMLILLLRTIAEKKIEGDLVELGVYRGFTAKLFHYYMPERQLHLFDTFEGFTDRGARVEMESTGLSVDGSHFDDVTFGGVKEYIAPKNSAVHFYKGYFPDTLPDALSEVQYAFVHLDADLYEPIMEGLRFFYPRMSVGGFIVVHDYNAWPGARQAVDEFFADKKEIPIPMPDKSGSALLVKG